MIGKVGKRTRSPSFTPSWLYELVLAREPLWASVSSPVKWGQWSPSAARSAPLRAVALQRESSVWWKAYRLCVWGGLAIDPLAHRWKCFERWGVLNTKTEWQCCLYSLLSLKERALWRRNSKLKKKKKPRRTRDRPAPSLCQHMAQNLVIGDGTDCSLSFQCTRWPSGWKLWGSLSWRPGGPSKAMGTRFSAWTGAKTREGSWARPRYVAPALWGWASDWLDS